MLSTKDIEKLSKYLLETFKDVFATKEDLSGLQTSLETKIDSVQISLEEKIATIEYRIDSMDSKIDVLQTSVDGLAKISKDNSEAISVHSKLLFK